MMNAIQDYAAQENVVGRVIAKEAYLSIGRCLGMVLKMCIRDRSWLKLTITLRL